MKAFLDEDFLLTNAVSRVLYHEHAAKMPVIDYHCHVNPREIYDNRAFSNLAQAWLGGDHYKWRLMRGAGVQEKFITGDASDYEKFCAYARVLGRAIGNPLHHWSHLELQRYFGYKGMLNEQTAQEVWDLTCAAFAAGNMRVRDLILKSRVTTICTTDDPIDRLEWHEKLRVDTSFSTRVLPAWRPDKAMNIEKPDYLDYLEKLATAAQMEINSFFSLCIALHKRMDFFADRGCVLSDHGLDYVPYQPAPEEEIESIFARVRTGKPLNEMQIDQFKTAFMLFMGKQCARRSWVMQLHFGCKRDNNKSMHRLIGPDTGFDAIGAQVPINQLADFLDALQQQGNLPKTIVYSLNPNDDVAIDTILTCFNSAPDVLKMQHGSAWWFNDHLDGMRDQLRRLASTGYLAGFVGMLTDSRSFLSYPRHEYFRRILCEMLGGMVERGEFPYDMPTLACIVRGISYENASSYFGF